MKIISWNVNGIRSVEKKGFVQWLLDNNADIVCIQETKARPWQLSKQLVLPGSTEDNSYSIPEGVAGNGSIIEVSEENSPYSSYWSSAQKAGYSGTCIYTKIKPDNVESLGFPEYDSEGRVVSAFFGKIVVISAYFPNSQGPGLRVDYKIGFCEKIKEYCDKLVENGYDIVLCGDYNIAHTPIDLANPKSNENNAGYLPEERDWMSHFLSSGYTDTFRMFCPEPKQYTWWSYRFHAREKNIGWRIDYQCVNNDFKSKIKSSTILSDVTGSDHCPIAIEF